MFRPMGPPHWAKELIPGAFGWLSKLTDNVRLIRTYTATLDPASVGANTSDEQAFTVTGLTTSDNVTVNKPTHTTGIGIGNCRVSAANTLAVTFINTTAVAVDPPSENYKITAIRR